MKQKTLIAILGMISVWALATHLLDATPHDSMCLDQIRTDKATTITKATTADHGAWFVEMTQ